MSASWGTAGTAKSCEDMTRHLSVRSRLPPLVPATIGDAPMLEAATQADEAHPIML
jgi:hypothetical protein